MTAANWSSCLAATLKEEGLFVQDKRDPGGATMEGVTQRVYDAFRTGSGLLTRSVRLLEASERDVIYKKQYWLAVRGDDLPSGIDLMLFDEGVNSGPVRAIRDLQKVLGVKVDGALGVVTLQAVRASANRYDLIDKLAAKRLGFLRALTNWRYFGKGWQNRVARIRSAARAMV